MKMFKVISLCLCFSVFIFATESNSKVKSIMINKMFYKSIAETQDIRGICDESATVTGFSDYNGNNTVDLCYEDGTDFLSLRGMVVARYYQLDTVLETVIQVKQGLLMA